MTFTSLKKHPSNLQDVGGQGDFIRNCKAFWSLSRIISTYGDGNFLLHNFDPIHGAMSQYVGHVLIDEVLCSPSNSRTSGHFPLDLAWDLQWNLDTGHTIGKVRNCSLVFHESFRRPTTCNLQPATYLCCWNKPGQQFSVQKWGLGFISTSDVIDQDTDMHVLFVSDCIKKKAEI